MREPLLTIEPSDMAGHEPNTQQAGPEGTASLLDIKATVKFVDPEKAHWRSRSLNAEWNCPDGAAHGRHWNPCWFGFIMIRLFGRPRNIPLTQVIANL